MAKKFVRNITNTKLEGADKEPLFTNLQNDILSDDKNAYIRNQDEYFPITKSILDIKSPNGSIKIRKYKNTVSIDTSQSEEIKNLSKPKTITVTRPLKKSETGTEITLSLDPAITEKIEKIKEPKQIEIKPPLTKTETATSITLDLDPATKEKIGKFKDPKKIEVSKPLNIAENEEVIKITIDDLYSQIETKGAIKKEKTEKGLSLTVDEVTPPKEILALDPIKKEETDNAITLSIDPTKLGANAKPIRVANPIIKSEDDDYINLSIDNEFITRATEKADNGGTNIEVKSPLVKTENDAGITLSIEEDTRKEKDFKVVAPLELAEDETRRIVSLSDSFKNEALEKNKFSYPLVNDNGTVGLDSAYTGKILNSNIKVNSPLSMTVSGNQITISISDLENLIKSEIKKYMQANPIDAGEKYTFSYPLSVSNNNVTLNSGWESNIKKGMIDSVSSYSPISTSFYNNKLSVNTTSTFDSEFSTLKSDMASQKALTQSLSKAVVALQKKIG